ncbi:ParA family protein [Haloglomus litoreum]|uniref:ParA family protein n=1 Tax=Haloglomus litoreum TaxID=3034026 RepID=UPI0023E83599|nr:AAA family ATPase [Haloglomus sp. DT116]
MSTSTDIVSFYSFKGGTGRSTSLANVAHALAERGATVGCIDLDLAAPGLHMIFPNIGVAHLNAKTVHDHLNGDDSDIEEYIIDVGSQLDEPPEGELLLISGAVESPGDDNPLEMMKRALELRDDFQRRRDLDYLLLDSRSGLSNHMIPVFDKADLFLAFHRWTHQHKTGTDRLADWIKDIGVSLDHVMSVASNVPTAVPEDDIREWVQTELYGVSEYHIINTSQILRGGEEIVTLTHPDELIAEQYRRLASRLERI